MKQYCRKKIKHLLAEEAAVGKTLGYKEGAATVKWRKKQKRMHDKLINTAESYVRKQIREHEEFCSHTDKIYELSRKYKDKDEARQKKKIEKLHKDEKERLKSVIPNLNQNNEWDVAFYRHCKRLGGMSHVDDPWLPKSEKKIILDQSWKTKSPKNVSSARSFRAQKSSIPEQLIRSSLFSPSLAVNKCIDKTPQLLYLEDFVDVGGLWPQRVHQDVATLPPYDAILKHRNSRSTNANENQTLGNGE
mgnify:FL=1|jgi:hypothetical protein